MKHTVENKTGLKWSACYASKFDRDVLAIADPLVVPGVRFLLKYLIYNLKRSSLGEKNLRTLIRSRLDNVYSSCEK